MNIKKINLFKFNSKLVQIKYFNSIFFYRSKKMTISSPKREAKKVKIIVDRDPVETSFEKWAKPGHFSRTLAKGPTTTTWIWNCATCKFNII